MSRLSRAAAAAAAAVAFLGPVRTLDQLLLALSLPVALAAVAAWGVWLERRVLWPGAPAAVLRPFQAVYLGQLALLALAAVVLPLVGLVARAVGVEVPLVAPVVLATAAIAWSNARGRRGPPSPTWLRPLTLCGCACLAVVLALYSRHLSALGLDVHQHATWARDVLRAGHVPLAERGTGLLAAYPRTFHLLLALWDAAALGAPIGPWTKLMPFLQNALPALALAEALAEAGERRRPGGAIAVEVALGAAFAVYAFALVPMAYPAVDLSGTPRLSSNGLLLAPVVLVVLGHLHPGGRARQLAVASLPLLAAWALTTNPLVLVLLAVAGLPLLAATAIALPRREGDERGSPRGLAVLTAASLVLAALALASDPWVLSRAAPRLPPLDALLARNGVESWARALAKGTVTERDAWLARPPPVPVCTDARCLGAVLRRAALDAASGTWREVTSALADLQLLARSPVAASRSAFRGSLPPSPAQLLDWAGVPFVAILVAGVAAAAAVAIRERRASLAARLLAASAAAGLAGELALRLAARLGRLLSDGSGEREILAFYLQSAGLHLSIGVLWLPFATAVASLLELAPVRAAPPRSPASPRRRLAIAAATLAWAALPQLGLLNLDVPRRNGGFWGPVGLADVAALHRIERSIPPQDGVIVPAEHWHIGVEEWVIPVGDTTALLPYGDRGYLFNVYLGPAYRYGWRDLEERLCSPDPERRRELADEARVGWLLARVRGARSADEILRRTELCGKPVAAIGEATPVRLERDLALFRFRVP